MHTARHGHKSSHYLILIFTVLSNIGPCVKLFRDALAASMLNNELQTWPWAAGFIQPWEKAMNVLCWFVLLMTVIHPSQRWFRFHSEWVCHSRFFWLTLTHFDPHHKSFVLICIAYRAIFVYRYFTYIYIQFICILIDKRVYLFSDRYRCYVVHIYPWCSGVTFWSPSGLCRD